MINGITLTEIEQVLKFLKYRPTELGFEGRNFIVKVYDVIDNKTNRKKTIFTYDAHEKENIIVGYTHNNPRSYRLEDIVKANKCYTVSRKCASRPTRIDIITRYQNGESLSSLAAEHHLDVNYVHNNYSTWERAEKVNGDFYEAMIQANYITNNQRKGLITRAFNVLWDCGIFDTIDSETGLSIYTDDELGAIHTFGPSTVKFLRLADDIYTGRKKI